MEQEYEISAEDWNQPEKNIVDGVLFTVGVILRENRQYIIL